MRQVVNYIRVGYSSTSYAMWRLCRDIRRKSLPDLVDILTQKLAADDATFDGSTAKGRRGIEGLHLNQFSRRYIFHLLARLTAFTDVGAGRADTFDKYVARDVKNPFDIEHIWADNFAGHSYIFSSAQEFEEWRSHVASLLLLPADVNRSLQAKSYADKTPHYAKQNVYAASLSSSMYQHQPQFQAFRTQNNLPFKSLPAFEKQEQTERRKLVKALVNLIWSPERLKEAAA